MKHTLIVISIFLASCAYAKGARPPVKTWELHPDEKYCRPTEPWCAGKIGLVRAQDKEVQSFDDSKGYICMTKSDLQQIISTCPR